MIRPSKSFEAYETLVKEIETAVGGLRSRYPDQIRCAERCCDCCYAVFDLSLIEAVYINYRFYQRLEKTKQDEVLERADQADRLSYRLKRRIHKLMTVEGKGQEEILDLLAGERIRCPFLNGQDLCDLYACRPITCRIYGLPAAVRGRACTCGKSGFLKGVSYPTFHLDRIQERLFRYSRDLLEEIGAGDAGLSDRLVPLSNALLTDYDESFFEAKEGEDCYGPPVGR
jgi:Fe-S-cluster containining protein